MMQRQSVSASSEAHTIGDTSCSDVTDMHEPVTMDSGAVVSPVIGLAAPLSNCREQPIIETTDTMQKSSNNSGSQSVNLKPNCYKCKHRRELAGDAHSSCVHPDTSPIAFLLFATGQTEFETSKLHVRGNAHGVRSGWFMWPMNFDPVWLEICSGFEPQTEPKTISTEAE